MRSLPSGRVDHECADGRTTAAHVGEAEADRLAGRHLKAEPDALVKVRHARERRQELAPSH